jgi:hypothetical protein
LLADHTKRLLGIERETWFSTEVLLAARGAAASAA